MRLPAAISNSGMLTKWREASAITASTSGRMSEPPSVVMVPCALITVATPSSWYGLPDSPNPVTAALVVLADTEKAFHGAVIAAANAPTVARNPRRFEVSFMVNPISLLDERCNAIDFDQRITGESRNRNRRARWTSMRKIGFEDLVHAVVGLDLGQEDAQLDNVVHIRASCLDQLLDIVQHLGRMRANFPRLLRPAVMRAHTRGVSEAVMDDDGGDHLGSIGGLALVIQFANALASYLFRHGS